MAPLSEISKKINIFTEVKYHGYKANQNVFSYKIHIENHSDHQVKLLRRRWLIKDVLNETREVEGDGVVGEQPEISPAQSYSYTSWCPTRSEIGEMSGSYTFKDLLTEEEFEVEIPSFELLTVEMMN